MIVGLAWKDLIHDRLLSVCLILALSAIIAPLLILFGLKFGTVQTLRTRLVQDPKNREIRPMVSRSFSKEWFTALETQYPEAEFTVPMTRQISASLLALHPSHSRRESLTLLATAAHDPLLKENGAQIPTGTECVLTASAARSLQARIGDVLEFQVRRFIQGKRQQVVLHSTVHGILEERASGLKTAFVQLAIVEAVENYKDGRAVPAFGWPGLQTGAYPMFDGAVLFVRSPLTKVEEVLLTGNTGFGRIRLVGGDEADSLLGYIPQPKWSGYLLQAVHRQVTAENLLALQRRLRGREAVVAPWIAPWSGSWFDDEVREKGIELFAVTDALQAVNHTLKSALYTETTHYKRWCFVGADTLASRSSLAVQLHVSRNNRTLQVPVQFFKKSGITGSRAWCNAEALGKMNLVRTRSLSYDIHTDTLQVLRRGYAGFRMYARSIDDVEPLRRHLAKAGIEVHTQQERISEVVRLDAYTSLIFWLIASVGMIGAVAALGASLYAAVERKKKELNVLRLLGVRKDELVWFPITQGLMLSGSAFVCAMLVFALVSLIINALFQGQLQVNESLCRLTWWHCLLMGSGIVLLSVFAAALAAFRATRLDPAEALRDE